MKVKEVLMGAKAKAFGFVCTVAAAIQCGTVPVFAGEVDTSDIDLGFIKNNSNDMFGQLTSTVENAGASFYRLVSVICVIGLLVSIMLIGASFAVNKNSNKREENKSHIVWILIGAVIVFGAGAILGLAKTIGGGIL